MEGRLASCDGSEVEIWALPGPSPSLAFALDTVSLGPTVLWVGRTSNSLDPLQLNPLSEISKFSTRGKGERCRQWFPVEVRKMPVLWTYQAGTSNTLDSLGASTVILSVYLVETLGLRYNHGHDCNAVGEPIKLVLRPLQRPPLAKAVWLRGPYPALVLGVDGTMTRTSSTTDVAPLHETRPSAPYLAGALESVLPSELDGYVTARGSVLRVCGGLFSIVVETVVMDKEGGNERDAAGSAKICSTTDIHIVGAAAAAETSRTAGMGSERRTITAGHEWQRGPVTEMVGDQGPLGSPSCPPGESEWLRLVQQDFGGESGAAAKVVGAATAFLRGRGGGFRRGTESTSTGLVPGQGCLIYGPTGTGKTLLAR
ncbi:unnamed protein product [Discosporangium mesarthrocarpum]